MCGVKLYSNSTITSPSSTVIPSLKKTAFTWKKNVILQYDFRFVYGLLNKYYPKQNYREILILCRESICKGFSASPLW
jgi:hypothetical protein